MLSEVTNKLFNVKIHVIRGAVFCYPRCADPAAARASIAFAVCRLFTFICLRACKFMQTPSHVRTRCLKRCSVSAN